MRPLWLSAIVAGFLSVAQAGMHAQSCTGACAIVSCPAGSATTLSGTVYAPNGIDPLPNVLVFVPTTPVGPMPQSVSCDAPGQQPSGTPLLGTQTGTDGSFRLTGIPAGAGIPLVVQIGRWRRQMVVPAIAACAGTRYDTRLPRNRGEGDIPRIAIVTSATDQVECVLRAVGLDDSEFTASNGSGRIQLYTGETLAGAHPSGSTITANEGALMKPGSGGTPSPLSSYDVLLLPSQGVYNGAQVSAGEQAALAGFVDAGGRAYLTHNEYPYLIGNGPLDPFSLSKNWEVSPPRQPLPPADVFVNTYLGESQQMADWLQDLGITKTNGRIPFPNPLPQDLATQLPVQNWFSTSPGLGGDPLQMVLRTPGNTTTGCGRVVFDDYEVRPTNAGRASTAVFPAECRDGFLTPQERILEYSLFELSANTPPSLAPAGHDFGSVPVGVRSSAQTFTWTNGSAFAARPTLSITSPDFIVTDTTCTGNIAANGRCTVSLAFRPTALSLRTGTLTVGSSAVLTTASANLLGTGTSDLTFSTPYLNFGIHPLGSTTTLPLSVYNVAPFPVSLQPLTVSGDFAATTHGCATAVPAGSSCQFLVSFTPAGPGYRVGQLRVPNSDPVNLLGQSGDFAIAISPASGQVEAGRQTSFQASLTTTGQFVGEITLHCSTDAPAASCDLPASVNLVSGTPTSLTVNLSTTGEYTVPGYQADVHKGNRPHSPSSPWPEEALALPLLILLGSSRRRRFSIGSKLLLSALLIVLVGCSGKLPARNAQYTLPGTYAVTVSAGYGGTVHSAIFHVTVTR